jgi:hypothetical protein
MIWFLDTLFTITVNYNSSVIEPLLDDARMKNP